MNKKTGLISLLLVMPFLIQVECEEYLETINNLQASNRHYHQKAIEADRVSAGYQAQLTAQRDVVVQLRQNLYKNNKDLKDLKDMHQTLQADYANLQAAHTKLQADHARLQVDHARLQAGSRAYVV